ncbi:hypothetical protein FUA48_05265 [Flavobacterium alkalisoli]|uniref:Uncharacterized protein n=1 Tax=Flavobacterium alkalisoli TaxID=2602769 RepID=A0A5B9FTR7_9FLAO|nr:hypothetical protein [Flavobacterium alkalisoli]QEE49008.1 hypothetical protein FUA48_05265 [Flavobacterium alkalisoli]
MKKFFYITATGMFIISIYLYIQFNKAVNVDESCFTSDFEEVFGDKHLELNKIYDFSQILNCKEWDKMIIVGGPRANRTTIFLREGIALPEIEYGDRGSDSLLFYIINDGKLINTPIGYWNDYFLYFQDFNDCDYVILNKNDAVFKCIFLDYIGSRETLTFELVSKPNTD